MFARLSVWMLILSSFPLGGCLLSNLSATERLRDSVVGLNDEVRWQRMDLALGRVSPEYREDFATGHRGWGREFVIADQELMGIELIDGRDTARSMVTYRWYRMSSMTLRETTLQQEWRKHGNHYILTSERVVSGDRALLPIESPEESVDDAADSTSG